jgi:hypothetical protein
LPADLAAQLTELARKVVAEQPVGGQTAPEQPLESLGMPGLEPVGVPVDLDGWSPRLPVSGSPSSVAG